MVFHWSLSDSKFPQVSRTLLSILAVLNNAVVCMVSTRPPTSKSSSPFSNPLVTVPNAPIIIGIIFTCMFLSFFTSLAKSRYYPSFHILSVLFCCLYILILLISNFSWLFAKPLRIVPSAPTTISITVTLMFHSFFSSPARSKYLSIFSLSFIFTVWSAGTVKSLRSVVLFFIIIDLQGSGQDLAGIPFFISKSLGILYVSFSRTVSSLCLYHLVVWSNFIWCSIPSLLPFPPSLISFCTSFLLVC